MKPASHALIAPALLVIGALAMLGLAWSVPRVPTLEEFRASELQRFRVAELERVHLRDRQLRSIAKEIERAGAASGWAGEYTGPAGGDRYGSVHLMLGVRSYALLTRSDVIFVDPSAPEELECPHETLVETGEVECEADRVRLHARGARCEWVPREFEVRRDRVARRLTGVPPAKPGPGALAAATILTCWSEELPEPSH